jgi:FRG domain
MARIVRSTQLPARRPHATKEVVCTNWSEVADVLDAPGGKSDSLASRSNRWIFRGQADSSWKLENSIRRTFHPRWREWKKSPLWNSGCVLRRIEGKLALEFSSRARLYGLDVATEKPVALLSAMQHFGVPTRLLDWTHSGYVALYFALEQQLQTQAYSAAVWALDLTALHTQATNDVLPVTRLKGGIRLRPPVEFVDFGRDETFKKHVLPDLDYYHQSMLLGEPRLKAKVVPLAPRLQNERLSAQQGLFLCPAQVGSAFMEQLEAMMENAKEEWLIKIVIPRALRDLMLKRLFQMNIHSQSLFPGTDGLGRFCQSKIELWGLS